MTIARVACVGGGVIGSSWAVSFARAGASVAIFDASPAAGQRSLQAIDRMLSVLETERVIPSAASVRSRIELAATLGAAVEDAEFVQESVREDLQVKQELFAALDRAAPPRVILASSTSEIPASQFTRDLDGRARCLVAHPLNPPHLIPLVEISPAPWTDPDIVARARQFFSGAGHDPILVQREIPGFIANRLQVAVIAEALRLVEQGYCTAEDLDRSMSRGLGLRWTLMGPFATNRLAAPMGYAQFFQEYWPTLRSIATSLEPHYVPTADIGEKIEAALVQSDSGVEIDELLRRRDVALIRLAKHLKFDASRPEKQASS